MHDFIKFETGLYSEFHVNKWSGEPFLGSLHPAGAHNKTLISNTAGQAGNALIMSSLEFKGRHHNTLQLGKLLHSSYCEDIFQVLHIAPLMVNLHLQRDIHGSSLNVILFKCSIHSLN